MKSRIAIVSDRDFDNFEFLEKEILLLCNRNNWEISLIVSGGASGADNLAERFADKYQIKILIHYPDWDLYGKKAGFVRNQLIVDDSDIVIAFWDGASTGTKSTIDFAKNEGKEVIVIHYT